MTETNKIIIDVTTTLNYFLRLAEEGDWTTFDSGVGKISNSPEMLGWLPEGFEDGRIDARDLAISISEKTNQELAELVVDKLENLLENDPNLHLRRKAAIALFVKGNRSESVIKSLKDASMNDVELQDQTNSLLASL